jgi:hypothetical protein
MALSDLLPDRSPIGDTCGVHGAVSGELEEYVDVCDVISRLSIPGCGFELNLLRDPPGFFIEAMTKPAYDAQNFDFAIHSKADLECDFPLDLQLLCLLGISWVWL